MAQLHHLVITTECLNRRVCQFQRQFGFRVFAHRTRTYGSDAVDSVAMSCNSILLVLEEKSSCDSYCSEGVSDVAWHVPKIDRVYQTAVSSGATITSPLVHGRGKGQGPRQPLLPAEFSTFTVQSPFSSVKHTVISGVCQCGSLETSESIIPSVSSTELNCLPGFVSCKRGHPCNLCSSRFPPPVSIATPRTTHIDHVTFACHVGTAAAVMAWYEKCLGLSQMDIYSSEGAGENGSGFIIPGDNGMKMLAMQYWHCAETVLSSSGSKRPVILVLAEPLRGEGENQVTTFLRHNGGPGVQHVALHTGDIVGSVSSLRSNGVQFITPPPEYYSLLEKVKEISAAGEKVELLQENCILIDSELRDDGGQQQSGCRYLMQVFSKPIFEKETLFFEIIQRCGANGFGEGNILALWKALDLHLRKKTA